MAFTACGGTVTRAYPENCGKAGAEPVFNCTRCGYVFVEQPHSGRCNRTVCACCLKSPSACTCVRTAQPHFATKAVETFLREPERPDLGGF